MTDTGQESEPSQYEPAMQEQMKAKPPLDPWVHRGTRMRCKTCMWFVEKASTPGAPISLGPSSNVFDKLGRCRRHAPSMNGYPVVFGASDWCGDHKLNENS